ncbi:MAG TPA: STM4014 family protein [Gemmataceae bacterium]|nr:STM4014 family protein [Gemmataceae bacterium]
MPRHVVIANPASKRWLAYEQDWRSVWAQTTDPPELVLVPWADVVARLGNLDGVAEFDQPAVVRLESPGRDERVTRLLVAAGDTSVPNDAPLPKGLIWRPAALYRGFARVQVGLKESFAARRHLVPTADPLELAVMFDKTATARRLTAVGVPVPEMLEPPATAAGLLVAVADSGWPRAYVKLNTGASATGMVVLHTAERPFGISTMVRLEGGFYSTRRLNRLSDAGLNAALEFLLAEGAIVQRGIPMAQIDGQNFDLRVVVLDGRPAFTVFRLSPHPMTNLHLGGGRGDWTACRAAVPTRAWLDALDDAVAAAGCFDARMAGVDLVFERGSFRHFVLEVNAFGDFFPGYTDEAGRTVHQVQIESLRAQLREAGPL